MPSWKPDCLKASATLNQISHTIQSAKLLHDIQDNHSQLTNDSKTNLSSKDEQFHHQSNALNKSDSSSNSKFEMSQSKALSFQNASSSKLSVQKGYSIVELIRGNSSQFGLTIAGGTDKDSRPRICDLKAGSIAHRSDELQIGDMIISINGIKTQGLKHEEIIDLIKNAGDSLCLEFEYNLPPWPIHPHHAVRSQTVHIQLEKENNSYGFTLRGGFNDDKIKARPLIVTNIRAGGPADREGTLKIGDRIIAINGINVLNANLQDAYCIIKQCKGLTLFLVEYDSAIVDSIKNSNGPLLIEIEKSPGSSIGIKLGMNKLPNGKSQILVESVKPASIADRCGAIYVGDQILSIDDVSFEHVTLAEANQILKNCVGEFSRVEILPLSQTLSNNKNTNHPKSNSKSLVDLNKEYRLVDMQKFGSINSCSASSNSNQVSHPESVELFIKSDENGTFGFTLQGAGVVISSTNNHANETLQNIVAYPVIGYVEPNSAAEKCGVMQPGDRIISVNNRSLEGLTVEEARQIIKESGSNLKLEIEYDVADTVMLTSGVFQVKLLKKNLDLGIVVAYPKYWKTENYPYISEIKKGSVAHRNGMLQPGDRILFIDNTSLRNKSLNEINHLLKTADEVVKLKIKKDEAYTEDNMDEKVVVYTVEMQRNGGPLGITISGSDDLFEPMFVSGLTEGGLAERTNAIHVGDLILAINNVSLKGKSLSEAIELLQNADDMVTLKISRKLEKGIRLEDINILNQKNQLVKNHQAFKMLPEKESLNKSPQFVNENSNSINSNNQYLPFPMDMTNFLKQSKLNTQNGNLNGKNHMNYAQQDLKKKASSLDSINAVERELDEVLKDLELNSQDLNEQLQETEYNQMCSNNNNNNNNTVELPISIQKSMNSSSSASNSCSSPSNSISRSNTNGLKPKSLLNSEFLSNGHESDLFIDDNLLLKQTANKFHMKSNEDLNKKLHLNNTNNTNGVNNNNNNSNNNMMNGVRKQRQNIISTYELCNECFDSSMLLTPDGSRQSPMILNHHSKCCKNNKSANNCSDFNYNNNNNNNKNNNSNTHSPNSSVNSNINKINGNNLYHQSLSNNQSPIKFANSNQDLTQTNFSSSPYSFNSSSNGTNSDSFFHNRPRPPLAQINESLVPDTITTKPMPLIRNNINNVTNIPIMNGSSLNGSNPTSNTNNVISQKVISIGIPKTNGHTKASLASDQSPSPKLTDPRNKPMPMSKMNGVSHSTNSFSQNGGNSAKDEDKLDKLPPVPPSTWSTNQSIRRRTQQQAYATNNAQNGNRAKPNGMKQNIGSPKTENYEADQRENEESPKLNELSIQESGSSSLEEDETNNSTRIESNNNSNRNSQTNGVNKNYDNFDLSETSKSESNEEKIETTISRDPRYKDFGFSISDNPFGTGIFINKVRNGSPAELNSSLIPFTQIFKINNIDCTKMDCTQVSKILANEQSNVMRLVLSKSPKNFCLKDQRNKSDSQFAISSSRATAL